MTARFVRDPQLRASAPPLRAVRRDPTGSAPVAPECRQVRQLVTKRAFHLAGELGQARVESDQGALWECLSRRAAQARVPARRYPAR